MKRRTYNNMLKATKMIAKILVSLESLAFAERSLVSLRNALTPANAVIPSPLPSCRETAMIIRMLTTIMATAPIIARVVILLPP